MTIEYVQKLVLVKQDETSHELRVIQVGAMPLAIPAFFKIEEMDGGYEFTWRWLPGESEECVRMRSSGMTGANLRHLFRRLRETKPWSAGLPATPSGDS